MIAPVLFTALAALLVELCVILPTTGVPTVVSLMLLAENDEAAPVALIFAELPTPLSRPAEMVPVLVIGPVLAVVWTTAPNVLATPALPLLAIDAELMPPVALIDTPAPLPEIVPVVTVPPVLLTPVALLLVDD